ncbi:hypothetical protein [Streptomyces sp. NPDC048172]|uniref:hypothetical protein n=1 Tax=Streptomyces sp. NPDC048172 TaxID=3365505 RepID=UPI00371587F9
MTVSMHDVRRTLDPEEPDYASVARLGPESLPHLRALVGGDDALLASKAAYAASLLDGDTGKEVVEVAARSEDAALRVAAASAAVNLPAESAATVLTELVTDTDHGVRKVARSSVPDDAPAALTSRVEEAERAERDGTSSSPAPDAARTATPMPGEQPGPSVMPGEGAAGGLMPGERPGDQGMRGGGSTEGTATDAQPGTGRMPGESG